MRVSLCKYTHRMLDVHVNHTCILLHNYTSGVVTLTLNVVTEDAGTSYVEAWLNTFEN